jgi:hypothetical protein
MIIIYLGVEKSQGESVGRQYVDADRMTLGRRFNESGLGRP